MVSVGNLFLAQSAVNSMADLKTAVGHALGIVVIISYMYAAILIIMACANAAFRRSDSRNAHRTGGAEERENG
jgi:hypothetical protein